MPYTHSSKRTRNRRAKEADFMADLCTGLAASATSKKVQIVMRRDAKAYAAKARRERTK